VTKGEDITWRQAGGAYYAETDGRIVGLLYWYSEEVHYLHGPGTEGVEPSRPGWFVVMADEPDDHREVMDAAEPDRGEELADLTDATQAALDAATRLVIACLDAARRA
jgi:hypothetical protein